MLYGGHWAGNLGELRHLIFHLKLLVNATAVLPANMPWTSDACGFYSLRAYHQIPAWKGNKLPVDEWVFSSKENICFLSLWVNLLLQQMWWNSSNVIAKLAVVQRVSVHAERMPLNVPQCGETCKGVSCTNHQECEEENINLFNLSIVIVKPNKELILVIWFIWFFNSWLSSCPFRYGPGHCYEKTGIFYSY